jgi:nucleoside-diphosphate-sugar epimerase
MSKTALIAGATGIVGGNLARHLVSRGWEVVGLRRKPVSEGSSGVRYVDVDLLDGTAAARSLADVHPTHVFISAWMRQPTEAQNIEVNSRLVRNLLAAVSPARSIEHVALVTGLKHYLGPFEMYGKGNVPVTPFREEQGRLDVENFYYAQEDEVFAAANRAGFGWSVHRPHTIIGLAVGNAMNMGSTLATYATVCRETGRPFVFPGSAVQWNGLTDMTDARLLARHLEWAATTPAARNQDFNVVNGDVFRWNWMWSRIAAWFDIPPAPFSSGDNTLETQLAHAAPTWAEIARKYALAEPNLAKLASPWHTDADLGRPIEAVTDMGKSRRSGFLDYQSTDQSFFGLFEQMRSLRLIP